MWSHQSKERRQNTSQLPTAYWKCFSKYILGYCWPLLRQRHNAVSLSTHFPPWPPFPQNCSPGTWPLACFGAWGAPPLVQDLGKLHEFPIFQCPQCVEAPLNRGRIIWYINYSSQFWIINLISKKRKAENMSNKEKKGSVPFENLLLKNFYILWLPLNRNL